MAGAGHGHVEQAQVFAQALGVVAVQGVVVGVEHEAACAIGSGQQHGVGAVATAPGGGKWQAHHRVLQAFAFVHGHHRNQVFVAFQAQHLFFGVVHRALALLHQPANQGLFTFDFGAGVLQQLGQVQHIGEPAFAVGLRQPARRQVKHGEGLAQHGQHAQLPPTALQGLQALQVFVQSVVVLRQAQQLGPGQCQAIERQRSARQPHVLRAGHGLQPVHQVAGFVAGKHRVFVRQIHRHQRTRVQGAADRGGLLHIAHQHRHVAGPQALESPVLLKAVAAVVEPLRDALGARVGHLAQSAGFVLGRQLVHQLQRGHRRVLGGHPLLGAAMRLHRQKRQGIGVGCAKAECASTAAGVGAFKAVVDGLHQRVGGAAVDGERVVAPSGGAFGAQIAVDVGPAKSVNGLFGVTNEQQRLLVRSAFAVGAVDGLKNGVLLGRCVLELIDHGHRKLLHDGAAQTFGLWAVQSGVQACLQVGKTDVPAPAFEGLQAGVHPGSGVQAHPAAGRAIGVLLVGVNERLKPGKTFG